MSSIDYEFQEMFKYFMVISNLQVVWLNDSK